MPESNVASFAPFARTTWCKTGTARVRRRVSWYAAMSVRGAVQLRSFPRFRARANGGRISSEALLATELRSDPEALLWHAVRTNVRVSANHVRHGSDVLEKLIQGRQLLVGGAEYSLETGLVDFFDEALQPAAVSSEMRR